MWFKAISGVGDNYSVLKFTEDELNSSLIAMNDDTQSKKCFYTRKTLSSNNPLEQVVHSFKSDPFQLQIYSEKMMLNAYVARLQTYNIDDSLGELEEHLYIELIQRL